MIGFMNKIDEVSLSVEKIYAIGIFTDERK
jgi:hypothetical protein